MLWIKIHFQSRLEILKKCSSNLINKMKIFYVIYTHEIPIYITILVGGDGQNWINFLQHEENNCLSRNSALVPTWKHQCCNQTNEQLRRYPASQIFTCWYSWICTICVWILCFVHESVFIFALHQQWIYYFRFTVYNFIEHNFCS